MKLLIFLMLLPWVARAEVKTVTAYCACPKCCGKWADGITASGKPAREGVTVAASRSIPFGTKLRIEGVGVRVVEDRLSKRYDHRVDIYFASHEAARRFGIRRLNVEVIK